MPRATAAIFNLLYISHLDREVNSFPAHAGQGPAGRPCARLQGCPAGICASTALEWSARTCEQPKLLDDKGNSLILVDPRLFGLQVPSHAVRLTVSEAVCHCAGSNLRFKTLQKSSRESHSVSPRRICCLSARGSRWRWVLGAGLLRNY